MSLERNANRIDELELIKIQLSHANENTQNAKSNLKQYKERCESLEYAMTQLTSKISASEDEEAQFESLLNKQLIEIQGYKESKEKMSQDLKSSQNQIKDLKLALAEQSQKIQVIEKQKDILSQLENSLRAQNEEFIVSFAQMNQQLQMNLSLKSQVKEGQEQIEKLKIDLSEAIKISAPQLTTEIETLQKNSVEQAQKISDQNVLLANQEQLIALRNNTIEELESENFVLRLKLNEASAENQSLIEKMPKTSAQVRMREERIRSYCAKLQQEKFALKTFTIELRHEVALMSQMNPAKDLLKLTEYELTKIETDFIKTPTSSPFRKSMEQALDQLIQQRDFLRSISEASQQGFTGKIEKLNQIARDFRLEELPPLPPSMDEVKMGTL